MFNRRVTVFFLFVFPVYLLTQWKITVPEGERVRLTFTALDLVPEVCGDFVQVFDGHEAGSSLIGSNSTIHVPIL